MLTTILAIPNCHGSLMLPNFLVIGAPKCGTSTLCYLLGEHPDVFMSEPKEIHYFGRADPEKTEAWYKAHFAAAESHTAVGEGSTSYTHPQIIDRCVSEVGEMIPDTRFIYIVRHPIRRLESDWKMRKREGWAHGSINQDALRQDTLIGHGLYWRNINRYRQRFADDQILVLFLEDMAADPTRELRRCFQHLGVDPSMQPDDPTVVRNSATSYRDDTLFSGWLRRTGVATIAKKFLPQRLISRIGQLLTHPQPIAEVEWDPAVLRRVTNELIGDSRRLLEYCGKPADYWDFRLIGPKI